MKEFLKQIKWQFLIFYKNNLVFMIAGVTAFYLLVVYLLKGVGDVEKFTTLVIFNEPVMVGFIFMGVAIILEKDQGVFSALFVTPINLHNYLISKIFVLSSVSLICAFGVILMAKGIAFNPIHFGVGAFFSCVMFSFVGLFVVSFTSDILHYILRSIPIVILMCVPMLNYFELTHLGFLKLFPLQGGLSLVVNSYNPDSNYLDIFFGYLLLAFWIPVLYWFVYRTFRAKLIYA